MKLFKRIISAISLLAVLALPLAGCSSAATGEQPATAFSLTDDRGLTVEFEKPAESIVSLAPSNTEIVFYVDAGDELVGRTDYCNFPAEVSSVESIGGYSTPNKERIVLLDPDVVLATGIHLSNGDVDWLEDQGLTVLVLDPSDIDGILDDILLVGELTGNKDTAAAKVAELRGRITYITDRTSVLSDDEKPGVLHVTWHDPLWTIGPGSFMDSVINMAGGLNIFSDISGDAQVDIEQAVTRNPQAITVVTGHGSAMKTSYDFVMAADSPFSQTDAYKNDSVFLINADLASRPGPRIVDALELVAKFIHPEIFP